METKEAGRHTPEHSVLYSPMTNRWYLVTKKRKDGSAAHKVDITDTLNAILAPPAERIKTLEAQRAALLEACRRLMKVERTMEDLRAGSAAIQQAEGKP